MDAGEESRKRRSLSLWDSQGQPFQSDRNRHEYEDDNSNNFGLLRFDNQNVNASMADKLMCCQMCLSRSANAEELPTKNEV